MNLHQLRVLNALITRGSYTAAAEHLHLTQPAVSQQIKALESACGVRLVERANTHYIATHAGEVLHRYAVSMLHLEEEALHALEELRAGGRGRFVVGANTTGGMYIVPPLIAQYRERNPETEIVLKIDYTEAICTQIAARSLDVAFVGGHVTDRRFDVEPLTPDRLVLIAAPSHPLAQLPRVTASDLADQPFIVARYGSSTRRLIEGKLKDHGVVLRIGMEQGGTEDIKKAVESGLGIAMVSQWSVLREVGAGYLRQLEVEGLELLRHYEMITHKNRYYSPAAQAFIAFAREQAPKLTFQDVLARPVRAAGNGQAGSPAPAP